MTHQSDVLVAQASREFVQISGHGLFVVTCRRARRLAEAAHVRRDDGVISAELVEKRNPSRVERTEAQIIAANIDTVFLVTSLNRELNPRRLERYLVVAWESRANPVIVFSKADLCHEVEAKVEEIQALAPSVPLHVISAVRLAASHF